MGGVNERLLSLRRLLTRRPDPERVRAMLARHVRPVYRLGNGEVTSPRERRCAPLSASVAQSSASGTWRGTSTSPLARAPPVRWVSADERGHERGGPVEVAEPGDVAGGQHLEPRVGEQAG